MNEAIHHHVHFNGATAADLFEIYTNSQKHSAIHGGAETTITKNEGETFSLLNGNLTGKNLKIVSGRMIVQSWRGNIWEEEDPDSIVTLIFSDTEEGAKIELVHAGTPDPFPDRWEEIYWAPIREYLSDS